jgi:hypothetical protein
MKTLLHKIPPDLPLAKGGIMPLFRKEGRGVKDRKRTEKTKGKRY